ncbi:hypothetical protein P12x_003825 [Tundrisphaera lichenicola]|uniref:hypothetical protein n=1 Tax=Tundrisphaera lichenicola TaxID=2029860 RepID=UPI003EBA78ED
MFRLVAAFVMLSGSPEGPNLERIGRLDDPAILEASGIVRSRCHPGIYWVHNDSGNPPALFAVRRDGSLVRSYKVAAPNVDWEDIATDDEGHLYVGDIGNNNVRLPIRAIYRLDEPDPFVPSGEPIKPTAVSFYGFESDRRFDAEGLFVRSGKVFVTSKRLDGLDSEVFEIPFNPPGSLIRPAIPIRMARLHGASEPITGADLSADGRRLAVSTDSAAWVYQASSDGGWILLSTVRFQARDVEAICWDGSDLMLASEDRSIYRIAESTWKAARGDGR